MKKKKPSALDKQYRHVALLQRLNRRAAAQAAEQAAEQQSQQRELAGTCQQLRANILAGEGCSGRLALMGCVATGVVGVALSAVHEMSNAAW